MMFLKQIRSKSNKCSTPVNCVQGKNVTYLIDFKTYLFFDNRNAPVRTSCFYYNTDFDVGYTCRVSKCCAIDNKSVIKLDHTALKDADDNVLFLLLNLV